MDVFVAEGQVEDIFSLYLEPVPHGVDPQAGVLTLVCIIITMIYSILPIILPNSYLVYMLIFLFVFIYHIYIYI